MDLGGALSMDGLVGVSSECGSLLSCSLTSSNTEVSRFQKLGRSAQPDDCGWRFPKMARTESMVAAPIKAAPFLPGSNPHSLFPDGEQMLSFSSTSKQDALMLSCDETKSYYCPPSASSSTPPYLRNGGLYSGSSSWNMNGVLARVRGPFTPFQWLELEHQALIYKYIVAEVPIPANLLTPIRRSLISSGFPPLGWGSFYLEYPGNADPEPGRCRRTDGKKWRCSRDAVADQKYCERHMNRGRHRSRKHVEGQSGHAAKAMPVIAPSQSATTVSSAKSSSSVSIGQHQTKILQPNIFETSPAEFDKTVMNKENANGHGKDLISLSMLTSMNPKPSSALLPISKQHNAFESTSSRADFRLASTDSHLNPSSSSFSDNIFIPTSKLEDLQPRVHPLHHFIDDLPKTQSDHSTITWPEIEEMQSERTQLSISIPVASSDFSSSSSYPNHENLTPLPIKLSQEFDLVHMDSQAGVLNEVNQRQTSWIPISWEASMAGPLGEVLTNTNSIPKDQSKNCSSSSLNLLTDSWDTSCRLESSPTGVLQKNSFGSLTSSTGSSPRAENNKAQENVKARAMTLLAQPLEVPQPSPHCELSG